MDIKKLLLPFYFGSVSEEERLHVERELLTDPEALTDYLDLKRHVEAASLQISKPSNQLWERLKPKTLRQKRVLFSVSLGAALAAGIALFFFLQTKPETRELDQPAISNILFDSSSELPVSSGVL